MPWGIGANLTEHFIIISKSYTVLITSKNKGELHYTDNWALKSFCSGAYISGTCQLACQALQNYYPVTVSSTVFSHWKTVGWLWIWTSERRNSHCKPRYIAVFQLCNFSERELHIVTLFWVSQLLLLLLLLLSSSSSSFCALCSKCHQPAHSAVVCVW